MNIITDPMDYLEPALQQARTVEDLHVIQAELHQLGQLMDSHVLTQLIDEDDRDERLELADFLLAYREQLLRAHHRFIAYLRHWTPPGDDQAGL